MGDKDDARAIGVLQGEVSSLTAAVGEMRKETREDLAKIFAAIETLSREGCAKGQQHTVDLARLDARQTETEQRPTRWLGAVSTAFSVLSAIGVVAMWLHNTQHTEKQQPPPVPVTAASTTKIPAGP